MIDTIWNRFLASSNLLSRLAKSARSKKALQWIFYGTPYNFSRHCVRTFLKEQEFFSLSFMAAEKFLNLFLEIGLSMRSCCNFFSHTLKSYLVTCPRLRGRILTWCMFSLGLGWLLDLATGVIKTCLFGRGGIYIIFC